MLFDGVTDSGAVALAFANTACPDAACRADSRDLGDVLASLSQAGAIDAETQERLVRTYAHTAQAGQAAEAILRFRTVAIGALEALRSGGTLSDAILEAINTEMSRCGCVRKLVRDGDGYRTEILFEVNTPEDALMPVAHSLAAIITSAPAGRLKQCRESRCACYFIDTSKSATRAWCSMQRCGNRQKVANYYRREKERRP